MGGATTGSGSQSELSYADQSEDDKKGNLLRTESSRFSSWLVTEAVCSQASERSKVVCVKFPAASVDESYLRKLTEPFGKIVKILIFSSLVSVCEGLGQGAADS